MHYVYRIPIPPYPKTEKGTIISKCLRNSNNFALFRIFTRCEYSFETHKKIIKKIRLCPKIASPSFWKKNPVLWNRVSHGLPCYLKLIKLLLNRSCKI